MHCLCEWRGKAIWGGRRKRPPCVWGDEGGDEKMVMYVTPTWMCEGE